MPSSFGQTVGGVVLGEMYEVLAVHCHLDFTFLGKKKRISLRIEPQNRAEIAGQGRFTSPVAHVCGIFVRSNLVDGFAPLAL